MIATCWNKWQHLKEHAKSPKISQIYDFNTLTPQHQWQIFYREIFHMLMYFFQWKSSYSNFYQEQSLKDIWFIVKILQTAFWNDFTAKCFQILVAVYTCTLYYNFFIWAQQAITHHWFKQWLVARRQAITWANDDQVLWCNIASLAHTESCPICTRF